MESPFSLANPDAEPKPRESPYSGLRFSFNVVFREESRLAVRSLVGGSTDSHSLLASVGSRRPLRAVKSGSRSLGTIICMIVAISFFTLSPPRGNHHAIEADRASMQALVNHPFIIVNGNTDFDAQASTESWPGSGKVNDPYIIQSYDIDGLLWHDGIWIQNSTRYFEIRDCYVHDCSEAGIKLDYVTNGILFNNTCSGNSPYGILARFSDGNTIANNSCTLNNLGSICIQYSNNNVVRYNHCGFSTASGGAIDFGIRVEGGGGNELLGNICDADCVYGIHLLGGGSHVHQNRCIGVVEAILVESSLSNVIELNDLESNVVGIRVFRGGAGTIQNNRCVGNSYGIWIESSSGLEVIGNNCSENDLGIWVISGYWGSANHLISGNDCSNNSGSGIMVEGDSPGNVISANIASHNGIEGINISRSSQNAISDNVCSYNGISGIRLEMSTYVQIAGNVMVENGILLTGNALLNWVTHTIDSTNTVNGKQVYYGKDMIGGTVPTNKGQVILANCRGTIVEGSAFGNSTVGLAVGFCRSVNLRNTTSSNCSFSGIYVEGSDGSGILNASCQNNSFGLVIRSSTFSNITRGNFSFNIKNGIDLYHCSDCDIANATCAHNSNLGLHILFSDNNIVRGCLFDRNIGFGIFIEDNKFDWSTGNRVYLNAFIYNHGSTATYDSAHAQACDIGDFNYWNTTAQGNFWSDWQIPDVDGDGIVDVPYIILANSDHYPLTSISIPVPEYGALPISAIVFVTLLLVCLCRRLWPSS